MKYIALFAMICLAVSAGTAASEPVIVEQDWTLIRTIPFNNPIAANFNPVDGCIYVACRETDADGLYRIDGMGFTVKIASGTYLAGVVVDPQTGDIFSSDSYDGLIYRSPFGTIGRNIWVSGFHTGDDDPMGMAIAPMDYTGTVLAPGEALVVDGGYGGPDEVWLWSPASSEGEELLHTDDETLVLATDIAIGISSIHLVDGRETDPGAIYSVGDGGVLTPLLTSEPLADPSGITYDPENGDLLVLDQGDDRLVRIDPVTGDVSVLFTGIASSSGWAGVDINEDGHQLLVSAYDDDAIFIFARCDASGHPELDCDGNGIYDACDIADGAPDCNRNGLPDECDVAVNDCNLDGIPDDCPDCPPVEIIFIMDTSASMDDEAAVLCGSMDQVVATLEMIDLGVESLLLGICDLPGGPYGCLEDHITNLLGTAVPGSPPSGLEVLGDCTGLNEGCSEDWGLATAVVAGCYPWMPHRESVRLIIPLSDEGPGCGDPVDSFDEASITHAISVARSAGVIVSPITGTGSLSSVKSLAQAIADSTGGIHFNSTEPALDIADAIVDLVLTACSRYTDCNGNGILDECDISSGSSEDLNDNGVPDECETITGTDPLPPSHDKLQLSQNVPNPFNPTTTITFVLPEDAHVELAVFAPSGRRVATIASGSFSAGPNEVAWDGRDDAGKQVASGVYYYRLKAGDTVQTKKMVLLR
ncbi:MAG: T9SS type A sorting domain-containing protein [Candidatus Krumholzibacteriota bacterium]|nr:T9SS type A sorting domain-containing protein [Candidatus Krumholzibacteriota bacterium]